MPPSTGDVQTSSGGAYDSEGAGTQPTTILIGYRLHGRNIMPNLAPSKFDATVVTYLLSFSVGFMDPMFTLSLLKHSTKLLKMSILAPVYADIFCNMIMTSSEFQSALTRHEYFQIGEPRISAERVGSAQ